MKTRSEIKSELMSALTSPAWSQIKNSLLGNELISLGAEIIYRNQLIKDSFTNAMDYTTANYTDLITLARRNSICVTNKEPSYVMMTGVSPTTGNTVIKPYHTEQVGGITFSTIDYYKKDAVVTLYQGNVREMNPNGSSFNLFSSATYTNSTTSTTIDDISYYRLSENANPYSVRMYGKDTTGAIWEIPQYNPMLFSSSDSNGNNYFKLVTLEDGCIAVTYPFNSGTLLTWTCYFVESNFSEFAISPDTTNVVEVHTGSDDSLSYARDMYAQEMYKHFVVSSADDVKAYVNSHDSVLDCQVIPDSDSHSMSIYIKPKAQTNDAISADYSTILNHLKLYGLFFAEYTVNAGVPIKFAFNVTSDTELSDETKGEIGNIVKDMYAYEDMKFDDSVIATDVSAKVFTQLGLRVDVFLNVTEDIPSSRSTIETVLLPQQSSLRFVSTVDDVTTVNGWDCNGIIRCKTASTDGIIIDNVDGTVTTNVIGAFGKCLIVDGSGMNSDTKSYWVYDTDTATLIKDDFNNMLTSLTGSDSLMFGLTWLNSSTNPMFMTKDSNGDYKTLYVLYDTSFWHNPSSYVPSAALLFKMNFDDGAMGVPSSYGYLNRRYFIQDWVCVNNVVYHMVKDENNTIKMFRVSNGTSSPEKGTSYAPIALGTLNDDLRNVFVLNKNIFILTNTGSCYEIPIATSSYYMKAVTINLPNNDVPISTNLCAFFSGTTAGIILPCGTDTGNQFLINGISYGVFVMRVTSCDSYKVYTDCIEIETGLSLLTSVGCSVINADSNFVCYRKISANATESTKFDIKWKSYVNGDITDNDTIGTATSTDPIYGASPDNVGSIDYEHGIIQLNNTTSLAGTSLSYQAVKSAPQDSQHYFVLSDTPIIWK